MNIAIKPLVPAQQLGTGTNFHRDTALESIVEIDFMNPDTSRYRQILEID